MDKKKLLIVTVEYSPQKGGVASYLKGIATYADAEIDVIAHSDTLQKQGKGVVYSRLFFSKWLWPRWIRGVVVVARALQRKQYDAIVISHVLPVGYMVILARLIASARVPLIIFCHGMDIARPRRSWWKRIWVRGILSRAWRVAANSRYTKSLVEQYGVASDRCVVVYPGVDEAAPVKCAFERRQPIIVSLGRLVMRKGFDCVIMALPQLAKEVPHVKYIIAGDGPDKQRLKKLAFSLGVQNFVWFPGSVSDEQKHSLLCGARVLAMPSRDIGGDVEGFGIVFLEAARYGVPSIGSATGGIPEAIDDTLSGVLVDPMSTEEITHVLSTLLNNAGLTDNMGGYARERVSAQFTWPTTIEPFNAMLKEL